MIVPEYKAKTIKDNTEVFGYLVKDFYSVKYFITDMVEQYEIDIKTLYMTLDNGNTWYNNFNAINYCIQHNIHKINEDVYTVSLHQDRNSIN